MFHFSADWVRADPSLGSFATGSVSAYIAGRSHWLGKPISKPHSQSDIASKGICVPEGVTRNTNELWQMADRLERRKDGLYQMRSRRLPRVAIHVDAALPFGLSGEVARATADEYAQTLVDRFGVVVQWAVHNKGKISNDHAHFLISTRSFRETDFGRKVRQFDGIAQKKKELSDKSAVFVPSAHGVKQISSEMERMRRDWAQLISNASGVSEDHRSFARQGLAYEPAPYIARGEIEFQKREERRTGKIPAWKVAREIELRYREVESSLAGYVGHIARTSRSTRDLPKVARRARLRRVCKDPGVNSERLGLRPMDRSTARSTVFKNRVALRTLSAHPPAPVVFQHQNPERRVDKSKARRSRLRERWNTEAERIGTTDFLRAKLRLRDRLRSAMIEVRSAFSKMGLATAAIVSSHPDLAKTARHRRVALHALLSAQAQAVAGGRQNIAVVEQQEITACSKALLKKASALARGRMNAPSSMIEGKLQADRMRDRMAEALADHIRNAVREIQSDGSFKRLLERQMARSALIERERERCMICLRALGRHASRNMAIRTRLRLLDAESRALAQHDREELDALRHNQIELHSNFPNLQEIRLKHATVLQPREIRPDANGQLRVPARLADLALEVTRRLHCDGNLTRGAITAIADAGGIDQHLLERSLNKNRVYAPPPRSIKTIILVAGQEVGSAAQRLIHAAEAAHNRKAQNADLARGIGRLEGSEPEL